LQHYFQFTNALTSIIPNSQLLFPFIAFAITTLILTIIYLPIKQLIKTNSKNKQELASFKKWKTDASLFMAQWEKEPTCDNTIWENDLLIGNADAPIRITVACNPYCGPCAKAHKELDELVERYPNKVCIQIRLLCSAKDEEDKITIAVKAILQYARFIKNNNDMQSMLSDWFDWMNYEKWSKKWKIKTEINVAHTLMKHEKWNKETGITHTPTLFVNGRGLPGRYNTKEIEKMIPQLQDAFVVVK
jgi:thiol-disulfide isomerase/thioredoxin